MTAVFVVCYIVSEIVVNRSPVASIKYAYAPTILLSLICLCLGATIEYAFRTPDFNAETINGKIVIGNITAIKDRENSTELRVTFLGNSDSSTRHINGMKVVINLDHKNYSITEGDIIAFQSRLNYIRNLGNPEEFDYHLYMSRQGYLHTQTLTENYYKIVGHKDNLSSTAKHLRRTLVNLVLNSTLNPFTKDLINTAILGDASFIDSETRTQFSKDGIAHILAISGLHMSIILTIITLILRPIDYLRVRNLRIILSIIALLGFLYITGASPSAIRSSIMSIFVMIAILTHRENSSLNALCASAIIILTFSPNAIHDVGFQLSFIAVLMILLLYSKLNTVSPKREFAYYITSSIVCVVLANIGCTVVSAYYFHTIPLLSVLSNLIIIPVLPFFIGIGIIHIIFLFLGVNLIELEWILNIISSYIKTIAELSTNIPLSHIDFVSITPATIFLYFLLLTSLILFLSRKRFPYIIASLLIISAIVVSSTFDRFHTPHTGFVILNNYKSTPILYFNNGKGCIWCDDDIINIPDFKRQNINMLSKYQITDLQLLSDTSTNNIFPPFAIICGKRIATINATQWRYYTAETPVNIDLLVITKRYYGNITDLLDTFTPSKIVFSGGIYPDRLSRLTEECANLSIPYHSLSDNGAILITQ